MATAEGKKGKGFFSGIVRSFRDMKGEMKRVVWPSKKQTINNTAIVLVFMAIMAVIIGVFDWALAFILKFLLSLMA